MIKNQWYKLNNIFESFQNTAIGKFMLRGTSILSFILKFGFLLIAEVVIYNQVTQWADKVDTQLAQSEEWSYIGWLFISWIIPAGNMIVIIITGILLILGIYFKYKDNNLVKASATKEDLEEIKKLIRQRNNGENEENFLREYFGKDWEDILRNPQTYHLLKEKLWNITKSLNDLIAEKKELLKKFDSYHLTDTLQEKINNAINELNYDAAEALLENYLKDTDIVQQNIYNAHYQKALIYLEKVDYNLAKNEIEFIPTSKIGDSIEDAYLLNDYASIYFICAVYDEGLFLAKKALAISEKELGTSDEYTATCYNNIGELYRVMEKYPESLEMNQKALNIRESLHGDTHKETITSYNNLALVYADMKEFEQAIHYYEKAKDILEVTPDKNVLILSHIYHNYAEVYLRIIYNQSEKASTLNIDTQNQQHRETIDLSIQAFLKALPLYNSALEIRMKILNNNHPSIANVHSGIGQLYMVVGKYQDAYYHLSKALHIFQESFGNNHPSTATAHNNLARIYLAQNNYPKAYEHMHESVRIKQQSLDKNNSKLAHSMQTLEEIKNKLK